MTFDRETGEIEAYLDEYLFDGQFSGLIDREMIIQSYLKTMQRRQIEPVLAGEGESKFFCALHPQKWDSKQLARWVVRIDYVSANCRKAEQFQLFDSILEGFDLAYLRLSESHPLISLIKHGRRGFRAYADKVMFRLAIDPVKRTIAPPSVRGYAELEIPDKEQQLLKIAGDSFTINRFARDENFPAGFNDQLYSSWIANCLAEDQNVLCSFRKNELLGFIVVSDTAGTSFETFNCGFVELVAVDRAVKRRSVGTELIQAAAALLMAKNILTLHANTDTQNTGATRFFKAAGFTQFNSIREFHWWRK